MWTQQLQNAEKYQQTGAKGSGRIPSLVTQPADVKTISDLFSYVKQRMAAPYADGYKYKRIAGRLSGLSGPVGNRITNDSQDAAIRSSDGNVNKFYVAAQRAQMYAGEKKESIARMANANALTGTPETTAGTAPNTNISITNKNVNRPRLWATAKRSKKSPPCFL